MMYKIKAPNDRYDRKIGGVQFVNGEAQTESRWLAEWFSGRTGFTVAAEKEKRRNDKGNADGKGEKPAAEPAGDDA